MDTSLSEERVRIDADPPLTMLQGDAISEEEGTDISDEVEDLSNSLREAVHDSTIRPKLQCLMMDPSFSMVTVQGEDSGIQWETSPSRASTPWLSDGRGSSLEFCSSATERSVTPGSGVAGRIIFIMDEQKIVRRKRTRERDPGRRSRAGRETPVVDADDSEGVAPRPELVGFSLPNVRGEGGAAEEGASDPREEKEQRLFRLVSEGSEILNIVVPPKLASVDEEESKAMEDNLSFMEETPVAKPTDIDGDEVFDPSIGVTVSGQAPTEPGGVQSLGAPGASHLARPDGTDPPGAPVARPPRTGAENDTDYFETFTLMDAAPGAPAAVIIEGQEETGEGAGGENQAGEEQDQPGGTSAPTTRDRSGAAAVSGEDITSDDLDEVFYGGTDDVGSFLEAEEDGDNRCRSAFSKSSLKKSGSSLFGSQEDVLTPIYLNPGPPKIIDPALLDEPKAMAFLYTDLYEEAVGSREKEEDAESEASERSFHSRQSDREARGYLEKFFLKDETPVVDMEPDEERRVKEERLQKWSEHAHKLLSQPGETQEDMPEAEEEITDFLRTSGSSSPCDAEPFPPLLPEENATEVTEEEVKDEEQGLAKEEEPQPQVDASGETLAEEGETQQPDEPLEPSSESSTQEVGKTSVPEEPVIPAISLESIAPAQTIVPEEPGIPEISLESIATAQTIVPEEPGIPEISLESIATALTIVPEEPVPAISLESIATAQTIVPEEPGIPEISLESIATAQTIVPEEPGIPEISLESIATAQTIVPEEPGIPEISLESIAPAQTIVPEEPVPEISLESIVPAQTSVPEEPVPAISLESIATAQTIVPEKPVPAISLESIATAQTIVPEEPVPEISLESIATAQTIVPEEPVPEISLESIVPAQTSVPEEPVPAISQKCIAPAQEGKALPNKEVQQQQPPSQIDVGITNEKPPKLVAPPRRKTTAPKATLGLAPLSPIETAEEGEGVGGKEQREEEKEKASPAETADEGEGDGDETEKVDVSSSPPAISQDALLPIADNDDADQGQVTRTWETEAVKDEESNQETENRDTAEAASSPPEGAKVEVAEAEEGKEENCDREPAEGDTRLETAESESAESAETEVNPEKGGAVVTESAEKDSGNSPVASKAQPIRQHERCIIL